MPRFSIERLVLAKPGREVRVAHDSQAVLSRVVDSKIGKLGDPTFDLGEPLRWDHFSPFGRTGGGPRLMLFELPVWRMSLPRTMNTTISAKLVA